MQALHLVLPQKSWNPWAAAAVSLSFLSVVDGQVAGLGLDSTLNLEATPCPVQASARRVRRDPCEKVHCSVNVCYCYSQKGLMLLILSRFMPFSVTD